MQLDSLKQKLRNGISEVGYFVYSNPKTLTSIAIVLVALSSIVTSLKVMSLQDQVDQQQMQINRIEQRQRD